MHSAVFSNSSDKTDKMLQICFIAHRLSHVVLKNISIKLSMVDSITVKSVNKGQSKENQNLAFLHW